MIAILGVTRVLSKFRRANAASAQDLQGNIRMPPHRNRRHQEFQRAQDRHLGINAPFIYASEAAYDRFWGRALGGSSRSRTNYRRFRKARIR